MKLHQICGRDAKRPFMSYIQYKDGFFYATDGHMLVKVPASMCLPFIDFPQNKTFYVSATEWRTSKIWEAQSGKVVGNTIEIVSKKGIPYTILLEDNINYPSFESFKSSTPTSLERIALDASLLATIQESCFLKNIILEFTGKHSGIRILSTDNKDFFAMLMPVQIPAL